jgi:hypothetical protein
MGYVQKVNNLVSNEFSGFKNLLVETLKCVILGDIDFICKPPKLRKTVLNILVFTPFLISLWKHFSPYKYNASFVLKSTWAVSCVSMK